MAYQKINPKICGKHEVSTKEPSCYACLNLLKKEVKEESSLDSIKDYSEIKNFNSKKPNEFAILKKARQDL